MHWFWRAMFASVLATAAWLLFCRCCYPHDTIRAGDVLFPVILPFAMLWGNSRNRCRMCGRIMRRRGAPRHPECGERI